MTRRVMLAALALVVAVFVLAACVTALIMSRPAPDSHTLAFTVGPVSPVSPGPTSTIEGDDTMRSLCFDMETDRNGRMFLGACLTLYADGSVGIQRDDQPEQMWAVAAEVPDMERRWFQHRYQVLHLLACRPDPVAQAAWPRGRYVSQCGWFST